MQTRKRRMHKARRTKVRPVRAAGGGTTPREPPIPKLPPKLDRIPFVLNWHRIKFRWPFRLLTETRCTGLAVETQTQTQWCWAAVSASVARFYNAGSTWTQCSVVNAELAQTSCCTNGSTAACNQPWFLNQALTRVGCLDVMLSGTLTFVNVRAAIDNGRPLCARQGWSGGGGHFMAIVCYFVLPRLSVIRSRLTSISRLRISDPIWGNVTVSYATFVSGYQGSGTWTHTYRTQP